MGSENSQNKAAAGALGIIIANESLLLLPERCLFIPAFSTLVIADIHLGKLTHFRKMGIPTPVPQWNEDIIAIRNLVINHTPQTVVFLGDLFHSDYNTEYEQLKLLMNEFTNVDFVLTKGNHDIIPPDIHRDNRISIVKEYEIGELVLRHEPPKIYVEGKFYIIGHIHPGIVLEAKARQKFRLPCFIIDENVLLLPAFGKHTGLFIEEYTHERSYFVVLNNEVLPL